MPVYEHTSGERQHTAPGSLTDTELGLKALDPASGWSCIDPPAGLGLEAFQGTTIPAVSLSPNEPPADEPTAEPEADDTTTITPAAARRTKTRS